MPSRYPGSAQVDDSVMRLARKTEWIEPAEGHFHGLGQRTFITDAGDYSLFDARELIINNPIQISHG
jgi:type VI secretion system protein ImpE